MVTATEPLAAPMVNAAAASAGDVAAAPLPAAAKKRWRAPNLFIIRPADYKKFDMNRISLDPTKLNRSKANLGFIKAPVFLDGKHPVIVQAPWFTTTIGATVFDEKKTGDFFDPNIKFSWTYDLNGYRLSPSQKELLSGSGMESKFIADRNAAQTEFREFMSRLAAHILELMIKFMFSNLAEEMDLENIPIEDKLLQKKLEAIANHFCVGVGDLEKALITYYKQKVKPVENIDAYSRLFTPAIGTRTSKRDNTKEYEAFSVHLQAYPPKDKEQKDLPKEYRDLTARLYQLPPAGSANTKYVEIEDSFVDKLNKYLIGKSSSFISTFRIESVQATQKKLRLGLDMYDLALELHGEQETACDIADDTDLYSYIPGTKAANVVDDSAEVALAQQQQQEGTTAPSSSFGEDDFGDDFDIPDDQLSPTSLKMRKRTAGQNDEDSAVLDQPATSATKKSDKDDKKHVKKKK